MGKKKLVKGHEEGNEKPVEGAYMSGKEIEERLLEAGSETELDDIHRVLTLEGVPDGSVRGTISRLRKKGKLIFQAALTPYGDGKQLAVEAIIHDMKLPTIADGGREIFDAGVNYGMRALVAGVRLAQELSQMGIAQASPVIRMATEMRKAEGMSAQEAGQVAAENALAGAIQYLSERPEKKVDIATVPNPLLGIMARAMEPALTQAMTKVFAMFGGQPAQGSGQTQGGEQPATISQLPTGWSMGKEKQDKEEEVE